MLLLLVGLMKKNNQLINTNVVVSNAVNRSAQGFTLVEKRIVFMGVATLGGVHKEVKITAQEFADTFNLSINTAYEQLKHSVENLRKKYLTYQVIDGKKTGRAVVNWLQGYYYFDTEGYVTFRFSEYIFPYLFDLQSNFTKYKLKQACALRSVHSWRLLELFEQQRQSHKTGKINELGETAIAKNKNGWLKITIEEFYHAMEIPESYKTTFGLLRKKVIEPAVKELTEKDHWNIDWKAIKKGRKVVMLEFLFNRNPQQDLFD